jgi:hypothetical protein
LKQLPACEVYFFHSNTFSFKSGRVAQGCAIVATAAASKLRRRKLLDCFFSMFEQGLAKRWRFATPGREIEAVDVLLPWSEGD